MSNGPNPAIAKSGVNTTLTMNYLLAATNLAIAPVKWAVIAPTNWTRPARVHL
jgi:hypothetical protein